MNEQIHHESSFENNGAATVLTGRLREAVGAIVAVQPPAESLERALTRARLLEQVESRDCDGSIATPRKSDAAAKPRTTRLLVPWRVPAILGLAASCLLIVGIGYVLVRPRASLASVGNALAEQLWIHVVTTEATGKRQEIWFSPDRRITAGKDA